MHAPRPYGLAVEGGELSEEDRLFIDHEIRKLSNVKATSNLDQIKLVKELPDGGFVILRDMGGILKAVAHKEQVIDDKFEFDGLAKLYVPMLYSGVITKSRVRQADGVEFKITEQCRRRLVHYSDEADLPAKDLKLHRFVIKPNEQVVPEFIPQNEFGDSITTQYVQQRPTWYSGAMAEVMQIVGGYGRQDITNLPDVPIERASLKIPSKYIEPIAEQLEGVRLPAYSGVPPIDGVFQFNYKFYGTDAITFDTANKPWLVHVASSGVWAMPLPMIPATTTQAFREYIEEVADEEILKILDRFGGMPSGEGFPSDADFQAWRRAGVVIRVCDSANFYQNRPIFEACGWSFNRSGREGFNTCFSYDQNGVKVGLSFKLKLNFMPSANFGWLKRIDVVAHTEIISAYLSNLIALLPKDTHKSNAILYKLRRVPQEDILFQAKTGLYNPLGVTSVDVDYWDNLELSPIAILQGSLNLVGQGKLFNPLKFENQPQFKFPSVYDQGCISFDFSPLKKQDQLYKCDTVLFGYYEEDTLKVVKYFYEPRTFFRTEESDYEECMIVGEWSKVETQGFTSLSGNFYTTEIDERAEIPPVVTTTKIKGVDKGYDSKPHFAQDSIFWRSGSLWRHRYYTHETKTSSTQSNYLEVGICIPYFTRNSALHAKKNGFSNGTESHSLGLKFVSDPYTYRYWTNDPIFAWIGGLPVMNGQPYPKDGSPVWVEIENYNPSSPCSDFADQGPWIPNLPADYTWLIHPDRFTWHASGGGGAPKVNTFSNSKYLGHQEFGALHVSVLDNLFNVNLDVPNMGYFLAVPSINLSRFYRDACKVVFGDTEYANISEIDQYNRRYKLGYSSLVEHKSAYHFIGVINE